MNTGLGIDNGDVTLIQPLDDATYSLSPGTGIQIFYDYFNLSWPWLVGVASGIGVVQAIIGGTMIMISGSDSGMRENGKSKMMWAIAGLLMLGTSGFILRMINPTGFS